MVIDGKDWDTRYAKNDTPWDKGAAAPVIPHLVRDGFFPEDAKILVPGCGTGHDVAELENLGYQVTGLDISKLAITQAKNTYPQQVEAFLMGDLFDPDLLQADSFDVVWEHTCYCAIPPARRGEYVGSIHRLLRPGARLVGLFFTDTQMPEGEGPPHETSRDEVVEMFSPYFKLISEQSPPAYYPERESREWLMVWEKATLSP
ncbi:MAG: methyltransferase domain-containing protein [Akkermansiaceae bacterium]